MPAHKSIHSKNSVKHAALNAIKSGNMKDLGAILNEDNVLSLKTPGKPKLKRLTLKKNCNAITLGQLGHLAPVSVSYLGKTYTRSLLRPSPQESIVRHNLDLFVERVFDLVVEKARLKELNFKSQFSKNTLADIQAMCIDIDGIPVYGFKSLDGAQLQRNLAFAYAIRQFFKDEGFAMAVCRDAIKASKEKE